MNALQRLVFTKGYEQMSLQDILDEVRISSGAFHHYFGSRGELLDAFIERMKQESEKPLLPNLQDPDRTAIEKLQGFFDTLDRLRADQKDLLSRLLRTWYNDDNALVRQKVDEAVLKQRAPLVTEIVRQGIREGVFTTPYPDIAGEIILSLLQSMGNTHARLLLSLVQEGHDPGIIAEIASVHAAYMEAVERVLGAPSNSLHRTDVEAVKAWAALLRDND